MANNLPLKGLRVLTAEQAGAGPFGTMLLADLGAEVIKIEDPSAGGDSGRHVPPYRNQKRANDSLYFQSLNRNKKSITLNLQSDEGQQILHRLAAVADVLVNNLRGDVPNKLGLTYEHLREANPRIVCVSCSGYGTKGRWAQEPGYDYLIQARTGMMMLTGEPGSPPTKFGLSVVDFTAGLTTMVGLLAAVLAAQRDGVGGDVNVSLLDSGLALLNYLAIWNLNRGYQPKKLSRSQHPSLVPVGVFPTKDGWIIVMCMKDKFFARLCKEVDRMDLLEDMRFHEAEARLDNRDDLNAILDGVFVKKTTQEWIRRLGGKLPCGPVYNLDEALKDKPVLENERIWEINHPDFGKIREVGCPIITTGRGQEMVRAPFLGEHLEDILGAIGINPLEIAQLRQRGVV